MRRHLPPPLCRLQARRVSTTECPRAALYILPALPNVKSEQTWSLVKSTYIETVKKLAPAGAGPFEYCLIFICALISAVLAFIPSEHVCATTC